MKRKVATRKQAEQPNKKQQLADDAFDWSAAGGADDMIASDSGNEQNEAETDDESNDEEVIETADEKRIRLAKEYLEKIAEQEEGSGDEGEDGVDRIGARLHQEALEAVGKVFKLVAHNLQEFEFDEGSFKFIKGHRVRVLLDQLLIVDCTNVHVVLN
jgi:ribosomal RNA-processing protein 9